MFKSFNIRTSRQSSSSRTGDGYGITIHYNPPSHTLDIVLLHGLTGGAYTTWLHKGSDVYWPKDLLQHDISDARIMTFGYDADIVKFWNHAAQDSLSGYATDLLGSLAHERQGDPHSRIVFVAHSLGGLIVQEALCSSRKSPEAHIRSIEANTAGVCFLGTPHQGSDFAKWGSSLLNIIKLLKPANDEVVKLLERGSGPLQNVQIEFKALREKRMEEENKMEITCFYEQLPMFRSVVVPKESAIIDGELYYPIHASHKDMARFSNSNEKGYKDIVREIKRLAGDVPNLGTMHKPCYHIPFLPNKSFVGRESQLGLVEDSLLARRTRKFAITGLGGMGKTQLALRFAYLVKEKRPNYSIFWVPATSSESFEQAFDDIARELPLPAPTDENMDVKLRVKQYLSQESAGPWLFILDNADNFELLFKSTPGQKAALSKYLPASPTGLMLFTTRYQKVAVSLAKSNILELDRMDKVEAFKFFKDSLSRKDLFDVKKAEQLLEELTFLPLAIATAAAYINTNKISIAKYLDLLNSTEQDKIDLLASEFQDDTRYDETDAPESNNAVAKSWIVSFKQIEATDELAVKYLTIISCIEPKLIPRSLLPPGESEQEMVRAIGTLTGYSFISERSDGKSYDVHRLVHLAIRSWLRQCGRLSECTQLTIQHINSVFPMAEHENRAVWSEYLPHAKRILDTNEGPELEARYKLCYMVGRCFYRDSRYKDATEWLYGAHQWLEANHGARDTDTLNAAQALAVAYRENGQIDKAIELLEHIVDIQKTLAEDHPSRLASQHELASAYVSKRDVDRAIKLLEHIVNVEQKLPESHPSRLTSQHALAIAYRSNGQTQKTIELLEHVVKVRKRRLAEDQPYRLGSEHELAVSYRGNGQVHRAIELLEHVVQVKRQTLAQDHPERLVSEHELAIAYRSDGQLEKAIELLEHVVDMERRSHAEDSRVRLVAEHELAMAYKSNGQIEKAIELLEHVVNVEKYKLAEDDPSRLTSQQALAAIYRDNGKIKRALEVYPNLEIEA